MQWYYYVDRYDIHCEGMLRYCCCLNVLAKIVLFLGSILSITIKYVMGVEYITDQKCEFQKSTMMKKSLNFILCSYMTVWSSDFGHDFET